MATYVYVAAQDDNKVSIFTMDEASGALTIAGEEEVTGGPSLLAISPDRQTLYAGTPGGAGDHQPQHQPADGRVDPDRIGDPSGPAVIFGYRPHRPVPAVILLR